MAYLNHGIELIATVKKDNKDREALIVMLHNLIRIYALLRDYKAAARTQEQVIELYREILDNKETEIVATNWELQIKDQMLSAKEKKLQAQEADLQALNIQLETAKDQLHVSSGKTNGRNGMSRLEEKLRETEVSSNTVGLAGDVGKLLGKHEYMGAFVMAMTLFEHELVNWQSNHSYHYNVSDQSIKERLEAVPRNLFDKKDWQSIEEAIAIRHKIVHGGKNLLNAAKAGKLIEDLSNISMLLRVECADKGRMPFINKSN
jgi:tetratricopeptide (TPR) repeat protein